jgi:hypothetical protein
VLAVQLLDLVFDRKAVAIPARNVGCVETGERLRADDDVLEDLVDRLAEVDVAVGEGRAIVQDEAWTALAGLADLFVELLALPGGDPQGFAFCKICRASGTGCR